MSMDATSSKAGPLTRAFWFGDVDARPLALFRIGFGALLFRDWVGWWPNLTALFSPAGIFPNGGPMPAFRWSLFSLAGSTAGTYALWGIGMIAIGAFTAGFLTRLSTVVAWAFLVSLHNRNMLLLTGGDRLVELLLLTSVFTELGNAWSVDAKLWPRPQVAAALGLRFMQLEIALLYLVTARLKLRGLWRSGQGIWISLQHQGFSRPLGGLLLRFPRVCRVMNYVVMALEAAFPFLVFSPVARRKTVPLGLLAALAVQGGIWLTMRVGSFTLFMLWINVLWVDPEWLRLPALNIETKPLQLAKQLNRRPTRRQWGAFSVLTTVVSLVSWDFFIGSHVRMPTVLRAVHRAASLEQLFELFGVAYDVTRWDAVATMPDGSHVEVLDKVAPGLSPSPGWSYDPWYKLTFSMELLDRPALGLWLCRRLTEVGQGAASLALTRHARPPSLLGQSDGPEVTTDFWSGPCPAPAN